MVWMEGGISKAEVDSIKINKIQLLFSYNWILNVSVLL